MSIFIRALTFAIFTIALPCLAAEEDPQGTYYSSSKEEGVTLSKLVPDENGVMWFKKGSDGRTYLSMASGLSEKTQGFVVLVVTTQLHATKAVPHAQKLAHWFEQQEGMPKRIPVVAHLSNEGVGYIYYANGFGFSGINATSLIMSPKQAFEVRHDAVIDYKASEIVRKRHQATNSGR